ncbi:MAG: hypothetical protein ACFFED_05865, partial [Candidatus Thorarchaeota archaeon]
TLGLADSIRNYFNEHPRAKRALGVASAIVTNFAMIASGSPLLAIAAGTIMKQQDEKDKVKPDKLLDFFKEAIQDPEVRNSLKDAVAEGDVNVASNVTMALNQLGAARPEAGQFVDTMKSELTVLFQQIGIIRELVSYFEIPDSHSRIKNVWRLPLYIDEVLVIDQTLRNILDSALASIGEGKNLVILGAPGSGKTTALYALWKELDDEHDTALVWDTRDVSRVHEKNGILLFNDDIPETRELVRAIIERDVRGIVTTAREQEWIRLPIELRNKFVSINLPMLTNEVMARIAIKHLESQNIKYDENCLNLLVENARGSPIYIRYVVEEVGTEAKAGFPPRLTEERVRLAPKGMTDYVAGILARILFDLDGTIYKPKAGALPVLKTLLCLADMPNYETHEVHLNQVFFKIKTPSDAPGPFNAIKQYLARDPRFFSLKFMHDTLADVLRGRVDHPIVGDIRMLAQEMGATGRKAIESDALADGWNHVKGEYDIDPAGGLEPLLAYGYFAAKNFGLGQLDPLAIELATKHMDNPLSQGLFAITGPNIDQIMKSGGRREQKVDQESSLVTGKSYPDEGSKQVISMSSSDVAEMGLKELDRLKDVFPKMGERISKIVESKLSEMEGTVPKTRFDALEELMAQESVSPNRLSRALRRALVKLNAQWRSGKVSDIDRKGIIITQAAERLVLLDSMDYIILLPEFSEALTNLSGTISAAKTITRIANEIDVKLLDEKTRDSIKKVYDVGAKNAEKLGDYQGMKQFIKCKWNLFGIDARDVDYASDSFGRLMKLGRPVFALENISDIMNIFEEKLEYKMGIAYQAFSNLSNASITDQEEYTDAINATDGLFQTTVSSLRSMQLIPQNESAADLCTTLLASIISFTDNYVKKSSKTMAAESIYPLIHESMKSLVLSIMEVLKQIGLKKQMKVAAGLVKKIKGESAHRNQMIKISESLI